MSKEQQLKNHTRMTIKMSIFLKWCEKAVAPRHNMTWTQFKEATNAKSTADNMKGKGFADAKISQMYSAKQYPVTFQRIAKSGLLSKTEVDFWRHVVFPAGFQKLEDYEQMELLLDTNDDTPCHYAPLAPDEISQQTGAVRHAVAEQACRLDDIDKARQVDLRDKKERLDGQLKMILNIEEEIGNQRSQLCELSHLLHRLFKNLHKTFPMLPLPTNDDDE